MKYNISFYKDIKSKRIYWIVTNEDNTQYDAAYISRFSKEYTLDKLELVTPEDFCRDITKELNPEDVCIAQYLDISLEEVITILNMYRCNYVS